MKLANTLIVTMSAVLGCNACACSNVLFAQYEGYKRFDARRMPELKKAVAHVTDKLGDPTAVLVGWQPGPIRGQPGSSKGRRVAVIVYEVVGSPKIMVFAARGKGPYPQRGLNEAVRLRYVPGWGKPSGFGRAFGNWEEFDMGVFSSGDYSGILDTIVKD